MPSQQGDHMGAPGTGSGEHQGVPQGYTVVPVNCEQVGASLKIGVLVRQEPDPVAGRLVVLRDIVDAQVFLGAVCDAAGRVQQWVEVWVQNLDGLTQVLPAYVEALSNKVLDDRWHQQAMAFDTLGTDALITTGWESTHPKPTALDLEAMMPVEPTDAGSGHGWELCLDDQLLEQKQLPAYSTSLHRYLYQPAAGEGSPFVPITPEAPSNDTCQPMSQAIDTQGGRILPLNPGGGLMMVRPFSPIGLESYIDLLGGGPWDGVTHGRSALDVGTGAEPLGIGVLDDGREHRLSDGWLFVGSTGRWSRLIEVMHLKLRVLADAVAAVSRYTEHTQRPLFNLTPGSFQVRLGHQGCELPFLWTASATLTNPGGAVALPIQGTDYPYYIPGQAPGTAGAHGGGESIYHPQSMSTAVKGQGSLRIRQVLVASGASVSLEGTLTTQDQLEPAGNDLAWFRLNLAGTRVDLYAHLDRESAMAAGEWRFRTISQSLTPQVQEALRAAEGVPLPQTPFEVVPLLSSPCDLYALGVLAVRLLLVDKDTKLSVALDEVLSLARQVAVGHDGSTPLADRVRTVFEQDKRWLASLGPHRMMHDDLEPQAALDVVPPQLWWEVLGLLVRLFPGVGPDSLSRDYGDAPAGGIHKVYEQAMHTLDLLMLRTRSLIVIDWRFNREVHAVLRRHMSGLAPPQS